LNMSPYFWHASRTVGIDTMGSSSSKCSMSTLQQVVTARWVLQMMLVVLMIMLSIQVRQSAP
jgi:hypothetical protein